MYLYEINREQLPRLTRALWTCILGFVHFEYKSGYRLPNISSLCQYSQSDLGISPC